MTTRAQREERRALEAKRVAALVRALRADAKKKAAAPRKTAKKAVTKAGTKPPPKKKVSPAAVKRRVEAKSIEQARVKSLVREVKKSVTVARTEKIRVQKERERDGIAPPRVNGRFVPKPFAPPPPQRLKNRPPVLRGPRGEFAPKDTVGEERGKFVQVYLPGWSSMLDGGMAVSYSSLRVHRNRQRYLRKLRNAGDWRGREFRLLAEEIARETKVNVREVYTLGLSP